MWEVVILDSITAVNFTHTHTHKHTHTHTQTQSVLGSAYSGEKVWDVLHPGDRHKFNTKLSVATSQRSHNNATAIPSPGFQNKCVYRSSASHGSGEVQKTAMTTAAMTHKHSDRKAANTKADREKLYRKTIDRPIGVSRAEKQYPFVYLHLSAMKPRQRNQDNLTI